MVVVVVESKQTQTTTKNQKAKGKHTFSFHISSQNSYLLFNLVFCFFVTVFFITMGKFENVLLFHLGIVFFFSSLTHLFHCWLSRSNKKAKQLSLQTTKLRSLLLLRKYRRSITVVVFPTTTRMFKSN